MVLYIDCEGKYAKDTNTTKWFVIELLKKIENICICYNGMFGIRACKGIFLYISYDGSHVLITSIDMNFDDVKSIHWNYFLKHFCRYEKFILKQFNKPFEERILNGLITINKEGKQ